MDTGNLKREEQKLWYVIIIFVWNMSIHRERNHGPEMNNRGDWAGKLNRTCSALHSTNNQELLVMHYSTKLLSNIKSLWSRKTARWTKFKLRLRIQSIKFKNFDWKHPLAVQIIGNNNRKMVGCNDGDDISVTVRENIDPVNWFGIDHHPPLPPRCSHEHATNTLYYTDEFPTTPYFPVLLLIVPSRCGIHPSNLKNNLRVFQCSLAKLF